MRSGGESLACQDSGELCSRGDPELRKDPVQMRTDRAMGQIQLLPYLTVRQPFCRHLRNLKLLGCELVASVWCASLAALASGTEFLPSAVAPGQGAQCIERRARRAKQLACLDDASAPAQPDAERELQSGAI